MSVDKKDIVLIKGAHGLSKLADFLDHYEEHPLQEGSPMESMFLTCGRPVYAVEDIHLSYEDALKLLNRRFFCAQEQHVISYEMLPVCKADSPASQTDGQSSPNPGSFRSVQASGSAISLSEDSLADFSGRFVGYIQSYNRRMTVETLSELENRLTHVSGEIAEIKLFLTDLYLQIKETMTAITPPPGSLLWRMPR